VRIADDEDKSLSSVYIALSENEADELIGARRDLRTAGKGWHAHVSDSDYQREVTVYREDDETAMF
jgi:hypothetical protein